MTKTFTLISTRLTGLFILIFAFLSLNHIIHLNGPQFKPLYYENKTLELTFTVILLASLLAQVYGLWHLMKWSLWLYILTTVGLHIQAIFIETWEPKILIAPVIIIALLSFNYKNLK
ncbi:hypothetical protein NF867_03995 [Solitalea sp. MAHUQ-68]|uniref:Uncharacterized protein n=1 Tax=Solitalea agri TaxID=2953739 RepID=A0A9X2F516_9SPHI|nr:hypothetical protein [Solitalea agri]MCO4292023.1 hypothetical protein [Solitalea agri]